METGRPTGPKPPSMMAFWLSVISISISVPVMVDYVLRPSNDGLLPQPEARGEPEFAYGDLVRIDKGFYRGHVGIVYECTSYRPEAEAKYLVYCELRVVNAPGHRVEARPKLVHALGEDLKKITIEQWPENTGTQPRENRTHSPAKRDANQSNNRKFAQRQNGPVSPDPVPGVATSGRHRPDSAQVSGTPHDGL